MALEGVHERYVNFYTDFAFKKLFGTEVNKELLRSFLNSLLDGQGGITNLTYLNSEQLGTQELDRKAVFDVYCENDRGEKFLAEYEDSLKAFRDWYSVLSTAEHKGFALGMEEGMAKGMEEGEKNKALAIAKEMLSDGMSVDSVARYTNLPVEDIEQLQKL